MKENKHKKQDKETTEKVGFYVALTICMMAVGLAIWSAYASVSDGSDESDGSYFASLSTATEPVGQTMTGVTEAPATVPKSTSDAEPTVPPTQPATQAPTQTPSEKAAAPRTEDVEMQEELSALQAVLRVTDSLAYPTKNRSIIKQYSEEAVYSKTMGDYRAHTGCDFAAEAGETVTAMCGGKVKDISVSELYGVIVEVESEGFSVYYCGLDPDLTVAKGDTLRTGDAIGAAAQIPCECRDESHIHVEIRVGNQLIDPLSVINSDR